MYFSLYHSCISEPLRKTLKFLETACCLKFCVWQRFYSLHHFVRVQWTPFSNFCFSNVGSLIKLILHEPCKNSAQKQCVRQFAWLMTFYNSAHIRETTKFSQRCPFAHVQSGAGCKTFARHNKSQEATRCFLEILAFFLTEKKCNYDTRENTFGNLKQDGEQTPPAKSWL